MSDLVLVFPRFLNLIAQTRVLAPAMTRAIHVSSINRAVNTNDYRANREKFPEDDLSTRYTAGQGPSALDKASQSLLLTELVRGMWVVLESFFRPPYTLMYPFEKGALSPRFRGEHALRRYPSGKQGFHGRPKDIIRIQDHGPWTTDGYFVFHGPIGIVDRS